MLLLIYKLFENEKNTLIAFVLGVIIIFSVVILYHANHPTEQELHMHPETSLTYPGAIKDRTEFFPQHVENHLPDSWPQEYGAAVNTQFHVPVAITEETILGWYEQWLKQHGWEYDNVYNYGNVYHYDTFYNNETRYRYTRNKMSEEFDLSFYEPYGGTFPIPSVAQKQRDFDIVYTIAPSPLSTFSILKTILQIFSKI